MDFITVTSIGGSIWSFRKDKITMVSKRAVSTFLEEEFNRWPDLRTKESCAIILLDGVNQEFLCRDSYESIMAQLNDENE